MIKLSNYNGKYLPSRGATAFNTLDGSDVLKWLESIGETVVSNRDTGRNGEAVTKSGYVVSTNGYVRKIIKKKTAKRTVKKKTAKKTARRTNPTYKEHIVVAQLRPEKAREATRKRLNIVNRLYYDGAGWSEKIANAARFRSRAHAVSIAKLVVESKIHNNALRQIGVTEAVEARGKQQGAG